jgi:hypothetical protein
MERLSGPGAKWPKQDQPDNLKERFMRDVAEVQKIVNRLAEIKDMLEAQKPLYQELDDLILELNEMADVGETLKTNDARFVTLIDNFSEKNTCFKVAGVRRFDVELLTVEELEKKVAKAAKKKA